MKISIYILCCLFSLFITVDTGYFTVRQIIEEPLTFRLFIRILAALGWIFITYGIVMRKYKWVQKLCK